MYLKEIPITLDVEPGSVTEFVKACQDQEFSITTENVLELRLLAEYWNVDEVRIETDHFLNDRERAQELVIPSIQFHLRHNMETSALEVTLRENLIEFLDKPRLLELPLAVLCRVFSAIKPEDSREVFPFLMQCLAKFQGAASALFAGLDVKFLGTEELDQLQAQQDFRWCYLNDSLAKTLSSFVDDNRRAIRQLNQLKSSYQQLFSETSKQMDRMQEQFTRSEKAIEARLDEQLAAVELKYQETLQSLHEEKEKLLEVKRDELHKMKTAAQETCDRMVVEGREREAQLSKIARQSFGSTGDACISVGNALFRQNNKAEAALWYQRVSLSLHLVFHLIRMIKEGNGVCVKSH
jgi:hypothetical protein